MCIKERIVPKSKSRSGRTTSRGVCEMATESTGTAQVQADSTLDLKDRMALNERVENAKQ
jgi:hypothetical protein